MWEGALMATRLVKTIIYLDPKTRSCLEDHADERGVSLSRAAGDIISVAVDDRMTLQGAQFFQLGMSALLRYHPSGDLERIVREGIALARANGHG